MGSSFCYGVSSFHLRRLNFSSIKLFSFTLFFLVSYFGTGQNYISVKNGDWNDPTTWTCEGGKCNSLATFVPPSNLTGVTVTVQTEVVYSQNNPINLGNKASIIVKNGGKLTTLPNINVYTGSKLEVIGGIIDIGPGVLNNDGLISLTKGVLYKNGNVVNNTTIQLSNSCFILRDGNFVNKGSLLGEGNIKIEDGNIDNSGNWSDNIDFYYSNNSNLTGVPSTSEEIDEACNCIITNCDIEPGFPVEGKFNGVVDYATWSLFENYSGENINPLIYNIQNDKVLLKMVVIDGEYAEAMSYLQSFTSPSDFIEDFYFVEDDEKIITAFFPIAFIGDLNDQVLLFNKIYVPFKSSLNSGLILSQGDKAQLSNLGRQGWNVDGTGLKIGILSDSYNTLGAANTDIANGDLPSGVTVVQDYPYGPALDEGRAMMQIIHDVAPGAELFFRTGYISEGNFAAGIKELVEDYQCDIVVDDLTYLRAPFFQDGMVANAVDYTVATYGVQYFTSAGNFGEKSYEAIYSPNSSDPNKHDFSPGVTLQNLNLDTGDYILVLQWENDFYSLGGNSGAVDDLDIYLADNSEIILYGFNINNVGNDPVEIMPFRVLNATQTNLMIQRPIGSTPNLRMKYVVFRAGDLNQFNSTPSLNSSTIIGHANSEGAMAVGAVRWDYTPEFGGTLSTQASSSSGGLVMTGETSPRQQPTFTAPTGVETSVNLSGIFTTPEWSGDPNDDPSTPNFFGTSASAPHAAAVAALLLDAKTKFDVDPTNANPTYSVRTLLTSTATDTEAPGFDHKSGYGFISAYESLFAIANPTPELKPLNLEGTGETLETIGDAEFTMEFNGQFFIEPDPVSGEPNTLVYMTEAGGTPVALSTTYIDNTTLEVTIPTFIGNPEFKVTNLANTAITNGLDGGDSEIRRFFGDPIDVTLTVGDAERKF
ncbi:S8 family peptidase, partial [Aegicerativicinus sediminis]